jgi:hypothetical protein
MAAILSCVVLGVATDRLPVGSLNPVSPAKDYWVRLAEDIKISDPSIAKQSELSAGEPFCGDLTCTHPSREARKLVGLVWTHHKIGKGAYLGCAPIFTAINMRAELYLWLKPQKTERHRPLDDRAWRASVVYRDNVDVRPPRLETYDARIKEAPYVALEIHNKEVSPLQISQRALTYGGYLLGGLSEISSRGPQKDGGNCEDDCKSGCDSVMARVNDVPSAVNAKINERRDSEDISFRILGCAGIIGVAYALLKRL